MRGKLMEFLEYIKSSYPTDTPIFLNELKLDGVSDSYVRQRLAYAVRTGEIARYDKGIYYIPRTTRFGKSRPFFDLVLTGKYISNERDVYGFFAGIQFKNKIGLSKQIPVVPEIVTNRECSRKRMVTLHNQNVILRKPVTKVTAENVRILQFLDLFIDYPEQEVLKNKVLLTEYITEHHLTREMVQMYLPMCSHPVKNTLIESGLIFAFLK